MTRLNPAMTAWRTGASSGHSLKMKPHRTLDDSAAARPNAPYQPIRSWAMRSARVSISPRSEEHTSELQSRPHLVCRLLLEKKKNPPNQHSHQQKKKKNKK